VTARAATISRSSGVRAGKELSDAERIRYEWQLSIPGFGEAGQRRLRESTVLISRCGGVGGAVAYELAAAGVGKLVLCHAGDLKISDLNRQLLMTTDHVGKPRIDSVVWRLRELNPDIRYVGIGKNISTNNAASLISAVDLVVDCAPLFEERFAMNDACVKLGVPLVECAMYATEVQLTVIIPGKTPCLRCLYPETPPAWKRQFPVFGAVSGTVGCMGAFEAIKLLSGVGVVTSGVMLLADMMSMKFKKISISRNPHCPVCGGLHGAQKSTIGKSTP